MRSDPPPPLWSCTAVLLTGCLLAGCLRTAEAMEAGGAAPVTALAVDSSTAWREPSAPVLGDAGGWLRLRLDAGPGATTRLLLREPVAVPAWANDLTFIATNDGAAASLRLFVLLRDADGTEFRYFTVAPPSYERGVVHLNHPGHRGIAGRVATPGIGRPKPTPQAGATLEGPQPGLSPRGPLTWIGLLCEGASGQPARAEVFLQQFAFSGVTPATSALHYLWEGRECFIERDGPPAVTPAQAARKWYGRRYALSWEARARFDGQPILSGAQEWRLPTPEATPSGAGADYHPLLASRVAIPITTPGTYWVRVKCRWAQRDVDEPDEISEQDLRLDIITGSTAALPAPLGAGMRSAGSYLRLAPDRQTLVFPAGTPTAFTVACWQPVVPVTTVRLELQAIDGTQAWDAVPGWSDGRFTFTTQLPPLAPGTYRVTATLRQGERIVERSERLVGMAAPPAASQAVPPGVPGWKEVATRREPRFALSPMLPDDPAARDDDEVAWKQYYQPFLDRAAEISREVEWPASWRALEPLPGVYDWRLLDRFLDHARSKGITVVIRPEIRAGDTPDWVPGHFDTNEAGFVQGHPAYLFQGGRLDLVHDPELRVEVLRFITALVGHASGHPALQGYMFCYEHPGDAIYAGWREGFSPATIADFRRAQGERLGVIAAANQRWGTAFASWAAVTAPDARTGALFWLDWLRFRSAAVEGLLADIVRCMRALDDRRPIVMYLDGITDRTWFIAQGCTFANGGSHDAMGLLEYAGNTLDGSAERTEDHSPGDWTAYFPSQPEASLFAMLSGGGLNTDCKAFVFTAKRFADAGDPERSLGRYRRLMPVWSELRQTVPVAYQAFLVGAETTVLLRDHAMVAPFIREPWETLNVAQAQLPACYAHPRDWPRAKLLIIGQDQQCLDRPAIDALVAYVENGGTLLMRADSGRHCIEPGAADWALLTRLGFPPPGEIQADATVRARPADTGLWGQRTGSFRLRDCWQVAPIAGTTTEAVFAGDHPRAAISSRTVGKGRVAVIWAQTVLPPLYADGEGASFPLYRAAAVWAGVALPTSSENPLFWTSVLASRTVGTHYGLVHLGVWQGEPAQRQATILRWHHLPPGTYAVSEVLSGRALGTRTAAELAANGLPLELGPHEVAVFRFVAMPR